MQSNRRCWLDHRYCHYLVEMVIYRACSLQIAKHSIINNANIFLSAVFIEVLLESLQNNKSSEWGRITRHELYNILLITKYGSQETKQSIAYSVQYWQNLGDDSWKWDNRIITFMGAICMYQSLRKIICQERVSSCNWEKCNKSTKTQVTHYMATALYWWA